MIWLIMKRCLVLGAMFAAMFSAITWISRFDSYVEPQVDRTIETRDQRMEDDHGGDVRCNGDAVVSNIDDSLGDKVSRRRSEVEPMPTVMDR